MEMETRKLYYVFFTKGSRGLLSSSKFASQSIKIFEGTARGRSYRWKWKLRSRLCYILREFFYRVLNLILVISNFREFSDNARNETQTILYHTKDREVFYRVLNLIFAILNFWRYFGRRSYWWNSQSDYIVSYKGSRDLLSNPKFDFHSTKFLRKLSEDAFISGNFDSCKILWRGKNSLATKFQLNSMLKASASYK